jgi:DNA-binding NarL/FixJ family response regulator
MIKVMIADDHQVLLDGLESMLSEQGEFDIVAKCTNGTQVLQKLQQNEPDILLLDINMPDMNGIEVAEMVRKKHPKVNIIALSMYKQPSYINRMLNLGAMGYILKDEGRECILNALQTVSNGEQYLSTNTKQILRNQSLHTANLPAITTREKEVLQLLAQGLTSEEIAKKYLSVIIRCNPIEKIY